MNRLFIFLFILFPLNCLAQLTISGRILNNKDKTPVANASVFLSNASVGAETSSDGTFILKDAKPGKYDLIVSILGFEPYSQKITINNTDIALPGILLTQKAIALKEVKIKATQDQNRERNYEWFKEEFLGMSDLANECRILNPDILNLDYDEVTRTLTASAPGFLEIENDALGYKIKYLLTDFTLNNQNTYAKKVHYEGSALFEKMKGTPAQEKRWQKQRQQDYEGSPMHFLRSAIADPIESTALPQFFKEGFWPMLLVTYPNPERPADSLIAAKIDFFKQTKSEISGRKDSLARWLKAAKLPKTLQKLLSEPLKKEDFVKPTDQKDMYALGLTRASYSLFINYNKNHLRNFYRGQTTLVVHATDNLSDPKNTENTLVNFNEPHAFFDRNGGILNVNSLTFQGLWGKRRMAELLPLDYVPISNDSGVEDNIISKLNSFTGSHIPEKAYLQFDKPYYAAGDSLYFKAYVTKGEDHQLSDISTVLHVDLINTDNKIDQSLKLQLNSGLAWGDFALPDSLPAGNYRVRAYTRWMQNDGEEAFFSQNIPIGSNLNNRIPESANTPGKLANAKPDIQFLPESGNLIAGISTKIAFKAIGTDGLGIGVKGILLDNNNKQVSSFKSSNLGMGYFYLKPDIDKTYKAKIIYADGTQNIVDLPKAYANGITLSVNNDSLSKATVKIQASNNYFLKNKGKDFILIVSSGGVNTKITRTLDSAIVKLDIFKKRLNTGIVRFTLFSPKGEALCERLAFIKNKDLLKLRVNGDKPVYSQREEVTIKLNGSDVFNEPAMGHFSVSVIDESKVPVDENAETTILTDLLLTSDLKGTVEQPNYYFTGNTDEKLKELDLVMLTHGYRRFEWKRIFDNNSQPVAYQPEKSLEISGTVTSLLGKSAPKAAVSLIAPQSKQLVNTTADDKGNFKFDNMAFTDSAKFILQAVNEKGNNRTKLIYNGDQSPPVTAMSKQSGNNQIPSGYLQNSEKQRKELSKLGLGKSRLLKEVNIKAIKKDDKYETQSLAGAGNADQVMHAEEIARVRGPLSISLNGRLRGVTFAKTFPNAVPFLTGGLGTGPMLVVIDGNEGGDLNSLSSSDVETIEVLKYAGSSIYGMAGGNGVLVITTKRSAETNAKDIASIGILPINVKGYYKAREFYSPKYESAITSIHPDLRSTIYWNPELTTDKDGNASFTYYNADGTGNYRVVIEGIDEKGNIGRQVYRYKVE